MSTGFLKFSEWLNLDILPEEWLIDNLLVRGGGGFLHGQPGAFKSFFLLQLGLDVAAGAAPLGVWKADVPKAVILLQAEGTRAGWRKRIKAHEAAYPTTAEFFSLHRLDLKVDSSPGKTLIWDELEKHKPALVIVDPLANWMTGSDTDDVAIDRWHGLWNSWRQTFGCAVLIGHHDRQPLRAYSKAKGGMATESYGAEEMRGHTRLYAWADFQAALKVRDKVSTLTVEKVREQVAGDEYRFKLEQGRLVLVGRSDAVAVWLLENLAEEPWITALVKDAAAATGMSIRTVQRKLEKLQAKGTVEAYLDGKKTRLKKVEAGC